TQTLLQHENITDAAVVALSYNGGPAELAAYYVIGGDAESEQIKSFCRDKLPDYMQPAYFVPLERLPLTVNGKLDRKFLPDPQEMLGEKQIYVAPVTNTEEVIVKIWEEILNRKQVSILDNFFEAGGHSLRATQVITRVFEELNKKVELGDLFLTPVLKDFAAAVDSIQEQTYQAIKPVEEKELYEVSYAQHRLWVLDQFEDSQVAYSMPITYELQSVNTEALNSAIKSVVERHESLRTTFVEVDGHVYQRITNIKDFDFQLEIKDFRHAAEADEKADELLRKVVQTPFDLLKGPLVKAVLILLPEDRSRLLFNMHHIISDGWSIKVLLYEVITLYMVYAAGKSNPLPPLAIQYKDYAAWQRRELSDEKYNKHKEYWLGQLSGTLPVLNLAPDFSRPSIKTYNGRTLGTVLDKELTNSLKKLAGEHESSLFMLLLAAVNALMHRYTGQEDLIIGTTIAGRDHKDLEEQIGFFVNTLPLRTRFRGSDSFADLLNNVKQNTVEAFRHQVYPFDKLVGDLALERDPSRSPLFDVMVNLLNIDGKEVEENDTPVSGGASKSTSQLQVSKHDLTFVFSELDSGLSFSIEYNTDLFSEARVSQMMDHVKNLLSAVAADPVTEIINYDYLPQEELNKFLYEYNDTASPYPKKKIYELITSRAAQEPGTTAVVFEDKKLTYDQLEIYSDKVATYLRNVGGVDKGDTVGLILTRNEYMPALLLGVLKSGAAYFPIDPAYPAERINYMVSDAKPKLILCSDRYVQLVPDSVPFVNTENTEWPEADLPSSVNRITDTAYIIYTSGSTGLPKGVQVTHKNLIAFIHWCLKEYSESIFDEVLSGTSYCFDISILEIFYTLAAGRTVRIIPNGMDIPRYLHTGKKYLLNTVPSVIQALLQEKHSFDNITVINLAGEVSPAYFREIDELKHAEVRNLYGPTEDTVYSTCYRYSNDGYRYIPIGKPIANNKAYILDENLRLVPHGVPGILYVGGDMVAKGYLNKKKLTREKFINNPFGDGRLYCTGDLTKWNQDGLIDFLGRIDNQVKIRGHRVELGEIESQIESHLLVDRAVVFLLEVPGGEQLIAFVGGSKELSLSDLTSYIKDRVPNYMVPAHFQIVNEWPHTSSGKIDRKALLAGANRSLTGQLSQYVPPRNKTEELLAGIWQQLFGLEKVGITDDFFRLGGDSIKAIQTVSRLNKEGLKTTIKDIFQHQTIRNISPVITQMKGNVNYDKVTGEVPLIPIQSAFLADKNPDKHHYNQSVMISSKETLDKKLIKDVLNVIVEHHDALRITLDKKLGENILKIEDHVQVDLIEHDFKQFSLVDAAQKVRYEANVIQSSIDLSNGPLIKACLFRLSDGDRLLIVIHHLAVDGVSWRILFEDIETLYTQGLKGKSFSLPPKTDSFKVWSERLSAWAEDKAFGTEATYWQSILQEEIPSLIEDDQIESSIKDYEAEGFKLDKAYTQRLLTSVNKAFNTKINDILLAALGSALSDTFGNERIAIDLEGHGREPLFEHIDVSRTLGWFTSLYPLVIDTGIHRKDEVRYLKEVKENIRRIPSAGIGYGVWKYMYESPGKKAGLKPEVLF
ncbi:MAG: amino acid adenylation domain-containing protein, partial [Cyclobacteriaceae bacterium]